jgi:hypothetical protein
MKDATRDLQHKTIWNRGWDVVYWWVWAGVQELGQWYVFEYGGWSVV